MTSNLLLIFLMLPFLTIAIEIKQCQPCRCEITRYIHYAYGSDPNLTIADCSTHITGEDSGSTIIKIPKSIDRSINILDFTGQSFTILTNDTFTAFNNLTQIVFAKNAIETIESHAFKNLLKLKVIYLHWNQINSLPDRLFDDLQEIRQIYLNNNNITYLQKYLFSNLSKLQLISISNNLIEVIEEGCFSNLRAFIVIDLSKNKLTVIHPNITDNLNSLKYFKLFGNPWHCNASLCPIIEIEVHYDTFYALICETPRNKKYTLWKSLRQLINQNIPNTQDKAKQVRLKCERYLDDTKLPATDSKNDTDTKKEGKINCVLLSMMIVIILIALLTIVACVLWLRLRTKLEHEQDENISFDLLSGEDTVPFPKSKPGDRVHGNNTRSDQTRNNQTSTNHEENIRTSGNN